MSEYPDDQCERTIQAWIKSNKALESERDALKAELLEVRVQASKGWYTPQKEAELERTKAELHHSRTLAEGLAEAGRTLLTGHDNLYVAHWPKLSPLNDIAAMPMRQALATFDAQKDRK